MFCFLFRLFGGKGESLLKTVSCIDERGNNGITEGTFNILRITTVLEVELSE
jgi:hypothetical protein